MSCKKTCKYIAVCVDISPSMGQPLLKDGKETISHLAAVNKCLASFLSAFEKSTTEENADSPDEEYYKLFITCGNDAYTNGVEKDSKFDFKAQDGGTAKIAKALPLIKSALATCSGNTVASGEINFLGYCVFITDGVVDSGESYEDVKKAIDELDRFISGDVVDSEKCLENNKIVPRSFCVGFKVENCGGFLKDILYSYTNKRIVSYKEISEYETRLKEIADIILKDKVTSSNSSTGEL